MGARDRLAFALDVPDLASARQWTERLAGEVGMFKVGLELFAQEGPEAIAVVRASGARCFLDLKLHDIPETVARAVRAASRHGADYLTVHAMGGDAMLRAAVSAAQDGARPLTLLAVTVLTSLDDAAIGRIGIAEPVSRAAARLAALASEAGVGGLVCSTHEAAELRRAFPSSVLVTPGIRPAGADRGDQKRVATATDAVCAGADLLVVGRPIRDAQDPVAAARALVQEIESATR